MWFPFANPALVARWTPPPAPASGIQYVGGTSAQIGTTDVAISLTGLTGGIAAAAATDDWVFVSYAASCVTDRRTSIGVQTGQDYTEMTSQFQNVTRDPNFRVQYKKMGATPDTTVTARKIPVTGDYATVIVHVYRGVDTVTPLDVTIPTPAKTSNKTQPNPPAITPVTSGALIVVAGMTTTGDGSTTSDMVAISTSYLAHTVTSESGNGFSSGRANEGVQLIVGDVEWTSGAYDPAEMTRASANETGNACIGVTFALKPA